MRATAIPPESGSIHSRDQSRDGQRPALLSPDRIGFRLRDQAGQFQRFEFNLMKPSEPAHRISRQSFQASSSWRELDSNFLVAASTSNR